MSEAEKRAIYEALEMSRKTYISKYTEESKRTLLETDRLVKSLNSSVYWEAEKWKVKSYLKACGKCLRETLNVPFAVSP